jgi:adenylate kinase
MSEGIRKIIILGPQGSGKGTQAQRLSEVLGVPAFAMGQLCRDAVAAGTDIGREIDAVLKRGELVSDQIAANLLRVRLTKPDVAGGYVLDGYPRNILQYDAFTFDTPTHVLVIDIPREGSLKRLGGRLTCDRCGKVYAMHDGHRLGDPCPCSGKLFQRNDDTPEAIWKRLEIYENNTQPVIARYDEQGLVYRIDGTGSIEEVAARIHAAIGI